MAGGDEGIGAVRLAEIEGVFRTLDTAAGREERKREAVLYGNVPTFMEVEAARSPRELAGADVAVLGFGYEGITCITPSRAGPPTIAPPPSGSVYWRMGADGAPAAIRTSSLFYSREHNSGYFPEIDPTMVLHEALRIVDYGDVAIDPADTARTLQACSARVTEIVTSGALPIVFGGDHTTPFPAMKAIVEATRRRVGLVVFDAHVDFSHTPLEHWASNQWPQLILETGMLEPRAISLIGVRSNRSSIHERQLAEALGVRVYTVDEVKQRGIAAVTEEAIQRATEDTDGLYVSLDIDCMEPSLVPGQKAPEIWGLTIDEIFTALRRVARELVVGFDVCELSPSYDPAGLGAQFCARATVEILAGLALRRRAERLALTGDGNLATAD